MCHWFLEETETQVTMNYPHVTNCGIQHVEEQSMPPFVAPRYARVHIP
jgi:hypothetical protein